MNLNLKTKKKTLMDLTQVSKVLDNIKTKAFQRRVVQLTYLRIVS